MDSQDIIEIHQLMALYGHAIDAEDTALVPQVYASDAVFDPRALGAPPVEGLDALLAFYAGSKAYLPPAHNMTNVYVYEADGETRVKSKWFMLNVAEGSLVLGDYDDVVVRTEDGWRIRHRLVKLRHPLGG